MWKTRLTDSSIVMLCCVLLITVSAGLVHRRGMAAAVLPSAPLIVLDAGHGGEDGGAVGADGTQEKDLNLPITLSLADLLRVLGFRVSLTRDTDTMVNATGQTLRERKVSDLHNRLAMSETAAATVSIHQNKFEQTQYSGTQLFYGKQNENSRDLAECIRKSVVSLLQPDNTRPLKRGSDDVFLLKKATTPFALVECGFLSNEAERERLKTPTYQQQLALAIGGGLLTAYTEQLF